MQHLQWRGFALLGALCAVNMPSALAGTPQPEPEPEPESLFSCVEVTVSNHGRITAARTVVGSGVEKSDKKALVFVRKLDLSEIADHEYDPATRRLEKKKLLGFTPGTGLLWVEHFDKRTFGVGYTGRLLDSCPSQPIDA